MTTATMPTTSGLRIEKREKITSVRYLVVGEHELKWQPSDDLAGLQGFFAQFGLAAFIEKDEESYFYGWSKDLKVTVKSDGDQEIHDLIGGWQFLSGGRTSNHTYWKLHLVREGKVTVTRRYEDNGNGDRSGRKAWTITTWEVKGGVAIQISQEDVQARLDAEARKQFAQDQAARLIGFGYSRQEAWDIIRAGGPGAVSLAFNMAYMWIEEWGAQRISLLQVLEACRDYARQPGESRNKVPADLDSMLQDAGLTVPDVKYGMMFAVLRAAIVMLEIGLPDLRPVDAVTCL